MNTPWQAVWLLAGEVSGVVAITFFIVWRLRSVVWQRTLWQASLLGISGVLLLEFAALYQTPNPKPKPEPQPLLSLSVPAAVQPVVELKTEERSASTFESVELDVTPLPVAETPPARQEVEVEPVAVTAKPVFETTPISREVVTVAEVKPTFPLTLALAIGVWLIGASVLAGRLLLGRALLLRFCARSQRVTEMALVKRVQDIAHKLGLGKDIQVLETERIHTPVVFGLFRRGIALPKGFTQRFAQEQQEAILAHELAHLTARDPLWYLLADALVTILWWHPLVWLARSRLHVTSEMAADEACVLAENGPETLAECLVNIAQEISPSGELESIGIEGSGFRSRLGQRVERLLNLSAELVQRPSAWRTRMVKLGMPMLLMGVLVFSSGWMRPDQANALKELPGMSWATLRTVVAVPPEIDVKRERVPLPVKKSIELAQTTNSLVPAIVSVERDLTVQDVSQGTNRFTMIGTVDTNSFFKELEKQTGEKLNLKVEGNLAHYTYQRGNLDSLLKKYLGSAGLNCEINKHDAAGTCVSFNPALGTLWVRGTEEEVEVTQKLLKPFMIAPLRVPNSYAGTNTVKASMPQRQRILQKLDQIVIKELFFDGQPLNEVVRFLREESENQDPEKKGINFIINSNLNEQPGTDVQTNITAVDLDKMMVKINPALKNLTMAQTLEAITQVATPIDGNGLQFSVNDYAVVFKRRVLDPPQMLTRRFKIDPKIFARELDERVGKKVSLLATNAPVTGLTNAISGGANFMTENLQAMARMYFADQGVNLSTNAARQDAVQIFFNDRTGILLVRAGVAELEKIQVAVEKLGARAESGWPVPSPMISPNGTNEVSILVQAAKQLYELRRWKEAETKLQEAMKRDPANAAAYYYLNLVQAAKKQDEEQRTRVVDVEKAREIPAKRDGLPVPNPYVRTNASKVMTPQRQRILQKLDQVVIKELFFDGLPLNEVVRFLQEESVKQDPEKRGINFIINSNLDDQPASATLDPLGNPSAPAPKSESGTLDLGKVLIKINPPVRNLSMIDVLSVITNVTTQAGKPVLDFRVEDYAVVFRQWQINPPQMFVRRFKVDTDSFMKGLKKMATASGLTSVTTSTNMQDMLREFTQLAGVNTDTNTVTACKVFYNDATGVLLVRASLQDMDVIQQAIEVINMSKALVMIEAKYIEVPDKMAQEMGLRWLTGSLPPATNLQLHGFINHTIPTNGNVRIDAPVLPNHVSILSASQKKDLLKQLEDKDGVVTIASPRMTTRSQNQAQISVAPSQDIVAGKVPGKPDEYLVSKVELGATLDVVPFVSMDGYSVQLTWIYSMTEFIGYDRPTKDADKNQPLPRLSVRQVGNVSIVRDGQTLMFGAGTVDKVEEGKRPGLFRYKPKTEKKHVIVLLTARIVDPAGNPVNRDEDLGY